MARYIETDDFEKQIKPYDTDDPVDKAMYNFAHNKMLCTPTADVVDRKHGKWIMHIDDLFPVESTMECSECHHEQSLIIDDNFCPNCGADMREDYWYSWMPSDDWFCASGE